MMLRNSLNWGQVQKQSKGLLLHRALFTHSHLVELHRHNNFTIEKANQNTTAFTQPRAKRFSSGFINGMNTVNEKTIGKVVPSNNRRADTTDIVKKPLKYARAYKLADTPYFKHISSGTLNSIKFRGLISALQKQEYDNLTDLYKGMNYSLNFSAKEIPQVQNAIAHYYNETFVQNFTSRNIASVLYSFSLLQFRYESVEQKTALFSLFDRFNATEPMKGYDLKCLQNFAVHGKIVFASLTKQQGDLFLKRIESIGNDFHHSDVNILLDCLATMGLNWHGLPAAVQNLLTNSIITSANGLSGQCIPSLIHRLANLQFKMRTTNNRELKKALHHIVEKFLLYKLYQRETISLFGNMSDIGMVYMFLPPSLRDAVRQAVNVIVQDENLFMVLMHALKRLQFSPGVLSSQIYHKLRRLHMLALATMSSNDVPVVLSGLASLGVEYEQSGERPLILKCVEDYLASTGNQAAKCDVITSMCAISVHWKDLSQASKDEIQSTLLVSLPLMSDQGVIFIVKGLGEIDILLSDLSDELRDMLLSCVNKCCTRIDAKQLRAVIYWLGRLVTDSDMPALTSVQDSIITALERLATRDFFGAPLTDSGLSYISVQGSSMPTGSQQLLWNRLTQEVPELAPKRLVNLWAGLGLLQIDYTDLPDALRKALIEKTQVTTQEFSSFELRKLLTSLSMMESKLNKNKYPLSFINALFVALERDIPSMNATQFTRFLNILGTLGVRIQPLPDGLKYAIMTTFEKHSVPLAGAVQDNLMESLKMFSSVAYSWSSLPHSYQIAVSDALKNQMKTEPLSAIDVASLVAHLEAMSLTVGSSVDPKFVSLLAKMTSAAMPELSAFKKGVLQKRLIKIGLVKQ